MTLYEQFKDSCLDLTILGLQDEPSLNGSPTPEGAKVLGWLIDSPICFCQLPERGEAVFAADPDALPEEQLIPVSEDIPHFIGLLIHCPDAALIAGAYQWSSFRFREQLTQITLGMKAQSVIRALSNTYQPPSIQDPCGMMAQLRRDFQNTLEATAWEVGFDKDFSQPCPKGRSGKELILNRRLSQKSHNWYVPSAFVCTEGIVIDAYLEVDSAQLLDFSSKWNPFSDDNLSISEKLQRQLDDPLTAPVTGILTVNDKPLRCKRSYTAIWNPLVDNGPKVRGILNHYRLDPDKGYLFRRYCFLRKGKSTTLRNMQLTLEATPVMVPGRIFTIDKQGAQFRFIHPATGLEHSFTALSLSNEALNPNFLTNHPCFYQRMNYALEPSISPENFRIVDCDPGDPWEFYQDEPAAVIYAGRKPDPGRYALSSLHYEPKDHVRWQMIFRRKIHPDIQLGLLL